jgi:hypothetical protein
MNIANESGRDEIGRDGNETKSPERLEREVDEARARVGRTASELSDRLSPGELLDQALGMAREHGGEFGRNLASQVKSNPIPLLLTSVGVSWMMMSSGNKGAAQAYDTYDYDTYDTKTDSVGGGIKEKIGDAAAKSRDTAAPVGDRVHGATVNMKHSAENARDSLAQFYREQPLLAGSLGVAIGAALGALVPPTELEDEMVGEASDRSVDVAKSTAARTYDKVRDEVRGADV